MFVSIDALPKSSTDGPEDWGDAWSRLAGASDDTQKLIENFNAGQDALDAAYQRRIEAIEQLTGTSLPNPMRVASERQKSMAALTSTIPLGDLLPELRREEEAAFDAKALQLADRYPQVNSILGTGIEAQRDQVMRDAEQEAGVAAMSPALGTIGRFTAQLAGGLKGAARDPFQWGMATFGASGSTAKTVAGRIGQTMLTEFLLNGGQEAVLQAASQERKRTAGVEHGLENALKNIGIAGTFGALFGGTVQGGAEVARLFKLGEGGAERAARLLDGRPERGDIETFAAETGVSISPDELSLISRSFEERTLDDIMVPENATPDDIALMSAAIRHAEDPDRFPSREIVERAMMDRSEAGGRTLSADDYQRIYDGDEPAVDAYRARPDQGIERAAAGSGGQIPADVRDGVRAADAGVDLADTFDNDPIRDQHIRPAEAAEPFDQAAMAKAETLAGDFVEPKLDKDGNIASMFEMLPFEDGNGNKTPITIGQALEIADQPNFHADLLEACTL